MMNNDVSKVVWQTIELLESNDVNKKLEGAKFCDKDISFKRFRT